MRSVFLLHQALPNVFMPHASMLGMSWMLPPEASTFAPGVDHLYEFFVLATIFFTVIISAAILYFFIKYRRRTPDEIAKPIAGSMVLETTWTVIPFLIAMVMFAWGAKIYLDEYTVPKDASDIYVVGKQWMWKFQHPEGQREINELHIPVGKRVRFVLATEDVIHSFYIPAFRIKEDIVPGSSNYTTLWAIPTMTGRFHIYCSEFCGTGHSIMRGWVTVMNDHDYAQWLAGGAEQGTMAQRGAILFQQKGCISCHHADGSGPCPKLEGIYGTPQLMSTGQKVIADDGYIRESILLPLAKIVAGYQPIMPSFQGQVSEGEIQELIAYIKSIGPAATAGAGAAVSGGSALPAPPIMSSGGTQSASSPVVPSEDTAMRKNTKIKK